MNMQLGSMGKRKLLSAWLDDVADSLKEHSPIQKMQSMRELLEKQRLNLDAYSTATLSTFNETTGWLDQLQAKNSPQLCSDLCAQSPWFGSTEKRLTGLNSAALFVPLSANQLAEKYPANTWQHQLEQINKQATLVKERLQRKIDRMTGVRAKTDEWETSFPEDE